MADELATRVIARHRRRLDGRARCITIDLDPTDDPTHGAQQYTLFNGYYDNWCYLPLLAFLTFDRESEQYLCAALLRHGKAVASEGTVGLLSRLLPLLRRAFPRARILVRLDGGFASPAVFDFLEAQPRLDYVVAMAKNAVLERYAEPAMLVARARTWRSEQTEHVYTETNEYQAGTWNHARRVVIKAEVVRHRDREPRDNPRFVVTNMRQTPRFLYEKVYCARGDAENRIKELKALQIELPRAMRSQKAASSSPCPSLLTTTYSWGHVSRYITASRHGASTMSCMMSRSCRPFVSALTCSAPQSHGGLVVLRHRVPPARHHRRQVQPCRKDYMLSLLEVGPRSTRCTSLPSCPRPFTSNDARRRREDLDLAQQANHACHPSGVIVPVPVPRVLMTL